MPDILDEMTKQEIIYFIRRSFFKLPRKSELLSFQWQVKTEENQKKREIHSKRFNEIDFKERDNLAMQFNKSTDINERLKLIKKLIKYDNAFQKWSEIDDKLIKEYDKNEKLYEQIDIQRKLEEGLI